MLAWLATIYQLLKAFPELVGAVVEIKKMWDQYITDDKRKAAMQQLTEGLRLARINKDTTQVTNLINGIIAGDHSS
jgi:hypothetical protein